MTAPDPIAAALAALPRVPLLALPTPLEPLETLSRSLGRRVWVKRDDVGGPGLGGNKLRKLELILAEATRSGIDTLITTGGAQSNHARLTAAVAARAGLRCELFLKGDRPPETTGNLMLGQLFGARITHCGPVEHAEIAERMAARLREIASEGGRAMVVPLGGAMPVGTLGYAAALRELLAQLPPEFADRGEIHLAGGTGSTAAGLALGAALWAPWLRVVVTSASWRADVLGPEIRRHFDEAAGALGRPELSPADVMVDDRQVGDGYTLPTPQGTAALRRLARGDGLVLDLSYTAKAMAGLIARSDSDASVRATPVVFLHSGGTPELFTRASEDFLSAP